MKNFKHSPDSRPWLRLVIQGDADVDDTALVRGLVAGEDWASRVAWARYAPLVYGVIDRALGSAEESEDLTQEVFCRVFAAIATLRDPTALRSFFYSSAIRMLRWHLRSKRVRRLFALSDSGMLPEASTPPQDSEGRELLRRFYVLLDKLSADDRTAFILRHIEELSLEQIVTATGASLATVKRRVRRATLHLAKLAKADADLVHYFASPGTPDES